MVLYNTYTEGVYIEYTDAVDIFREGVRSGNFVTDKTLSPVGFGGIEDTDWENVSLYMPVTTETTWRDGVRSGYYVLDVTLTPTGFAGVENTDWKNIYNII